MELDLFCPSVVYANWQKQEHLHIGAYFFLLILTPPECPLKPAVDVHTPTVIQNVCGRTLNLSLCVFFFVKSRSVFPTVLSLLLSVFVVRFLSQRLDGVTRSPVYSQLSETLDGLVTIRAFGSQRMWVVFTLSGFLCVLRVFYLFILVLRRMGTNEA